MPDELNLLRSKYQACLIGSALGDAFGYPFECINFSERETLLEKLDHRANSSLPWSFSDDTQMLIDLGRSLINAGQLDQGDLLRSLREGYDPVRGYGKGMKLIFRAMDSGQSTDSLARVAWVEGSKGNGGTVRLPPLACFYHLYDDLETRARRACCWTHAHSE
ncbi:MAG: ADP-ribosylglycohydrolase family protein, partial [Planctomycetota bacterium]|nr:ADP-ribosylglycohydrolase family protein [Planctomycetota bacterium]